MAEPGQAASTAEQEAYDELQCYTLGHGGPDFIHQHVVDAWAAQHADARTKPIGITFALVGLCLRVEHGCTGRYVQRVHMRLGGSRRPWPTFALPRARGSVTVMQVMRASPGPERDRAIDAWCASVWAAFEASHDAVEELLMEHGIV